MAEGGTNQNWGKKGSALGIFAVVVILFVILLIYVYNHPANGIT